MNDKTNLESGFYNADGTFNPLTASHGNIDGSLAHYRDTYMQAERDYFGQLLARDEVRDRFVQYIDYDSDMLFSAAAKIQEQLETGQLETMEELQQMQSMQPEQREAFHMRKLENAEGLMCLLLAATRDKVLIKELTMEYCSGGRNL